jgi:hypothetical protein
MSTTTTATTSSQADDAAAAVCIVCSSKDAKRCSRCKVVHYFSQACQKKHFGLHKNQCKPMAALKDTMDNEAAKLTSTTGGRGGGQPENLFETRVGSF